MYSYSWFIFVTVIINGINLSSESPYCPANQEYVNITANCPPTCEFRNPPCYITTVPKAGCQCKGSFIFLNSKKRRCVPVSSCPETCSKSCFEYSSCGTCRTCQTLLAPPCPPVCQEGCFCRTPYLLDEKSLTCVLEKNCPPI